MREAAKKFEFEKAAKLRDTIKELRTKEFLSFVLTWLRSSSNSEPQRRGAWARSKLCAGIRACRLFLSRFICPYAALAANGFR